jgi:hypothetical protein
LDRSCWIAFSASFTLPARSARKLQVRAHSHDGQIPGTDDAVEAFAQ